MKGKEKRMGCKVTKHPRYVLGGISTASLELHALEGGLTVESTEQGPLTDTVSDLFFSFAGMFHGSWRSTWLQQNVMGYGVTTIHQ